MRMKRFFLVIFLAAFLFPFSLFAQDSASQDAPSTASSDEAAKEAPAAPAATAEPAAPKQPQHPNKIVAVEVRGNQIVSTPIILSKMKSQQGDPLVQEIVNEDVKRLYAAGFFQDIKMEVEDDPEGYKLLVEVIEKPVIRQIVIKGASRFKEDKLRKEIKTSEGQILDRKVVKQGVEGIRKLYSNKGFGFVDVESSVDVNPTTKEATVTINILEGEKYRIRALTFEGNQSFKPKKLLKLMKTKKKGIFSSGVYKDAEFQKDLERLGLFYQQEGYLDAKVEPVLDYDKPNQKIFIKIRVEEGTHYVSGEVKIQGNQLFPESEIWQELEMLPGLTYSQYYLSKDIDKILNYYHRRGYMDARVLPDIRLNKETGKVDVTYQIQEGDLYFVDKVVIRGNTKTKDIVIRRELRIRPGERVDGEKIEKSKERLANLDYFEDITYDTEPGSEPNRKDLVFRVKEKRTGELSFGGGISSVDGLVGFGEISQRNFDLLNWPRFTGAGQTLSLRARLGTVSQDYQLNFIEPYLFGKPIAMSTGIYDTRPNNENVDFDEERMGAAVTFSKTFRDVYHFGTGYTLERVKIDELSEDAPAIVQAAQGVDWLSRWRAIISSYDSRDNIFNPTKGSLITFNGDLIGGFLGGNQSFYQMQTSGTKYFTPWKKHLLELKLRLGVSQEFGQSDDVPVYDRFYAGGLGSIRGYRFRRVGPKEAGNPVGGESIAIGNIEYTIPIPHLDIARFAAFVDAGTVHKTSYHVDFGDIALSTGPGLKVKTPVGPLAFYYGFPVANRDDKNKNGRFEFSLSRGF